MIESLLTISIGEYSAVEIVLRLAVVLMSMTALLLVLSASSVSASFRFPLFLAAVALGGAAFFEAGVWQSWKEAFELAGTSYAVSGHLIADQDRIIAWSVGVPVILFCFGLTDGTFVGKGWMVARYGLLLLLVALVAPFSSSAAFILLVIAIILLHRSISFTLETRIALGAVIIGFSISNLLAWHPVSLGGGVSGELVRGEILRTLIDILSLVIPSWLLLSGILRVSNKEKESS